MAKPPAQQLSMPFAVDVDDGESAAISRMEHSVEGLTVQQLRTLSVESRRRGVPYGAQRVVDDALTDAVFADVRDYEIADGLNAFGVFEKPTQALVINAVAIRLTVETARTRWGIVAAWHYSWTKDHHSGFGPRLRDPAYPTMAKAVVAALDALTASLTKGYEDEADEAGGQRLAQALGLITETRWSTHLGTRELPWLLGHEPAAKPRQPRAATAPKTKPSPAAKRPRKAP